MLGPGGEPGDDNLCFPACKQDGGDGSSMIDFMGPGTDGGDWYSKFVSVRSYSRWGDGTNFMCFGWPRQLEGDIVFWTPWSASAPYHTTDRRLLVLCFCWHTEP